MTPELIHIFWFSPVYHTRLLALTLGNGLAAALKCPLVRQHDLTSPKWAGAEIGPKDLVVLAVPVYAGRVPPLAAGRIRQLAGNGAPCVILVSYGNRAFDDALLELRQLASGIGLRPFAGAACVARHTIGMIYGEGRPNASDLAQVDAFGRRAADRLAAPLTLVEVPGGNLDKPATVFPLPQTVNENCVKCGHCWQECPAQAITPDFPDQVDKCRCICCMRCVAICPEQSRIPDQAFMDGIRAKLAPLCAVAKPNEFFGA